MPGQAGGRAHGDQAIANGVAHEIVHERAVAEAHFGFRRMHVYVHLFAIAIEEQQRERVTGRRHQVVIGGGERVQQQLVANEPAVHEQEDRIAIQLLHLRAGDEAAHHEDARRRLVAFHNAKFASMASEVDESSRTLPPNTW